MIAGDVVDPPGVTTTPVGAARLVAAAADVAAFEGFEIT